MTRSSLRLRLVTAGTVAVLIALALAAFGLSKLFEAHVSRRAVAELSVHLDQLAAGLERDAQGRLILAQPPADPRFSRPLSGLYWQVDTGDRRLRSRSLWDDALDLPDDVLVDGTPHSHVLGGPGAATLLAVERLVTLSQRLGGSEVRAVVAMDRAALVAASRAFLEELVPYLVLLGAVLIGAGWAQVAVGLRPLATIEERVAAVRSGKAARLGTDFPDEVRPLAAELDALIAAREAEAERARARAADLAHGLKTPVQALMGEAARLAAAGQGAAAAGVEEVATAMQRQVDRELARARAATAGRAGAADPAAAAARVLAVLRRAPDGDRLTWRLDAADGLHARINEDDLTDALGAVMDNAARFARAAVTVTVARADSRIRITVRDDGPGIPADRLARITQRGTRLDTTPAGAGLGLAIANDIAEAVGGSLTLRPADPGLEVALTVPAADALPA